MPDAAGNIKGIALGGKAGEAWERIFGAPETVEVTYVVPVTWFSPEEARAWYDPAPDVEG